MKIIELYESILKTANLFVTEDGYVNHILANSKEPVTVKGKSLVLPTPAHLANPNWENRIVFHPLSENILRAESDVLEKLRAGLNIRFNYTITVLVRALLNIAASPDEHPKLTPEQSDFLSHVKDADEKTIKAFSDLCDAMPAGQTTKSFVSIYLKRSGNIKGKQHKRCGIVSFPLYTELVNVKKDRVIFGVSLRAKDVVLFKNLFEWLIPGIGEPESYNVGADSQVAPYLEALMKAVANVASPLNAVIELFRKPLGVDKNGVDEADEMMFESAWLETFDNLAVMVPEIRMIPMQAGNEGKVPVGDNATAATTGAAVPVQQAAQTQPQFAATPVWQQPPQVQQQRPMMYAAQQQFQPPAPIVTERGLDFASLVRSVPGLAAVVGPANQPQQQQWQQGQPRAPQNQQMSNGWNGSPTAWAPGNNWSPGGGRSGGFGTT